MQIPGIHHVTAIAGDPQRNLDFYSGLLGLHLVKQTVNFDDPGTYHLYFGSRQGSPGTILTFFPWGDMPLARRGTGQAAALSFRVAAGSLDNWQKRLQAWEIAISEPVVRFGERLIAFSDPDGMLLEMIESGDGDGELGGFHSVTLSESGYEATANLLVNHLGFRLTGSEANRFRYEAPEDAPGHIVDLLCQPDGRRAGMGRGSIHHVAFRAASDQEQLDWRAELSRAGQDVTPVLDRQYFHSIYFREPGGVLFEIATDPPGFAIDEPFQKLGESLKLPPWLESSRNKIEAVLPPLRLPSHSHET